MSLYYKLLKNERIVNAYIDSLEIKTFEYLNFCESHKEFISKNNTQPNDGIPLLYDLAICRDYHGDTQLRSDMARGFSIKEFCVALELYNICLGIRNRRREIHYEMSDELKSSPEEHLIIIASLFYRFDISYYIRKFSVGFTFHDFDWILLKETLAKYIKNCFLNKEYPSYKNFLLYGKDHSNHYDDRIKNHFIKLLSDS